MGTRTTVQKPRTELTAPLILAKLTERMKYKSEIPVFSENIAQLVQALGRETTSAAQLATIILRDQGLTTKVLKLANAPNRGEDVGPIRTVSHAVAMLGFDVMKRTATSVAILDQLSKETGPLADMFRKAAAGSLWAGLIARQLASESMGITGEEAFVCASMHNLGKHLAYIYFPREVEKVFDSTKGPFPTDEALVETLGFSCEKLGMLAAKRWHLPEHVQACIKKPSSKPIERPSSPVDWLRCLTHFSNELVSLVQCFPHGPPETHVLKLGRYCSALGMKDKQVRTLILVVSMQLRNEGGHTDLAIADEKVLSSAMTGAAMRADPSQVRQRMIELFNAARAKKRLSPLSEAPELGDVAKRVLGNLSTPPTRESFLHLRTLLTRELGNAVMGKNVEYTVQFVNEPGDFIVPPSLCTLGCEAAAVAATQTLDTAGALSTAVLLFMLGDLPGTEPSPDGVWMERVG